MHDYSAFKEEVTDESRLEELRALVEMQTIAETDVDTLEAQLKEAKNGLKELNSHRIPRSWTAWDWRTSQRRAA